MNYYINFILLFMITNMLIAQNFKLPLWETNIPNHTGLQIEEIVDTNEMEMIRSVNIPEISFYFPSKKNKTKMGIIVVPGGGYNILAYDWEGTDVAKWLNSNGITAIVLKYRLPHTQNNIKSHLSPFLDIQRAIRLVRYNAENWGIDNDLIGVMGFSAGGHLASTLGTHFEDNYFTNDKIDSLSCRPDFMVLMYPVITFREPYLHKGSRHFLIGDDSENNLIDYFSNELHVSKNTPPTFIVHAEDDKSVPVKNSLMFYDELQNHSVPAEMHIYPIGGHGFSLALGKGDLESWKVRCIDWLKTFIE